MSILNFMIVLTAVTAVLLAVKLFFGAKLSPRLHMLLWLVLVVQLIAWPLSHVLPEADWSLRSYVPQVQERVHVYGNSTHYSLETYRTEIVTGNVTGFGPGSTDGNFVENQIQMYGIIWAAGAGVTAAVMTAGALRQRRKLKVLPDCTDESTLKTFEGMKGEMGIDREILLKTGAEATMLAGLRKPAVYLAEGCGFTEEELGHVFAHELTHHKHRDLWLNLISAAVLCTFWWNPVLWFAFRRFHLDMELYCDWDAVKVTGDRKEYAKVLVKAAVGQKRFMLATTSLVREEHQVTKRVKLLASLKKPKIWVSALAAAILLGVCIGFAVEPGETLISEKIYFAELHDENEYRYASDEERDGLVETVNEAEWIPAMPGEAGAETYEQLTEHIIRPQGQVVLKPSGNGNGIFTLSFYYYKVPEIPYVVLETGEGDRQKRWISCDGSLIVMLRDIWAVRYPDSAIPTVPEPERLGIYNEFQQLFVYDNLEQMESSAYWIYENGLYAGAQYDLYHICGMLMEVEFPARQEMPKNEAEQMLAGIPFDYWMELTPPAAAGKVFIGHHQDDNDGEGNTYILDEGSGRGWRVTMPELAYLLANDVKLSFGLESDAHDWRVCDADKSWEEAMEIFEEQYGKTYTGEELEFLNARNAGTYQEGTLHTAHVLEIQEVSAKENAVRFFWESVKTYYNDIWDAGAVWAGGGQEYTENPDGTVTVRKSYINHLFNDGEGWYHVNNGYDANTSQHLNEDGSLKDGLIQY